MGESVGSASFDGLSFVEKREEEKKKGDGEGEIREQISTFD